MILEGIVTTLNAGGSTNISPMGPIVDDAMQSFVLRPYQTSTTYLNLKRTGEGVFHVTDDVGLLARAAVATVTPEPAMFAAKAVTGRVLADACRWYAFRVRTLDDSQERVTIHVDVVEQGRLRDFFGFNRAKHAVVEAAILATRTSFLPADEILSQMRQLAPLVEKTGGSEEQEAWEFLWEYVQRNVTPADG